MKRVAAPEQMRTAMLLVFALMGCASEVVPGQAPVTEFEYRGTWMHVRTQPGTDLAQLLILESFGGFQPTLDVTAVLRTHGAPRDVISPGSGEEYMVYDTDSGSVWVGYQAVSDGCVYPRVVLLPSESRPAAVLKPVAAAGVRPGTLRAKVNLYLGDKTIPDARVEIDDGRVERILLFGTGECGSRPEEFQRFPG